MIQFLWLRKLIRRHTRKIPVGKAVNWKQRFAILYALFAFNAFAGVMYMCGTGRGDWMKAGGYVPNVDVPPARSWARTLGVKNAQVIQLGWGKVIGTYEIREDDGFDFGDTVAEDKEPVTEPQ